MKILGCALVLSLLGFSSASASMFYNATSSKYTIAITLPNGKVETREISDNSAGLDSESFVLAAGVKSVKVEITDDMGETAWKGSVNADDTHVLVPNGKGIKVVYSGVYGGPDGPKAVAFMNITGEPLTLDLEGHNGIGSARGVVPGTMFDPKKPVRLEANEATYDVLGKSKGGEKIEFQGKVNPGRYCLIWKDPRGTYRATILGKLAKPKK